MALGFAVVVVVLLAAVAVRQGGLLGPLPARVRVSVDDLAVGRFPPVCVKSGAPAQLRVAVESSDGGFQPWWLLLLLLGPLGIVAIAVLWAFGRRTNRVGGIVPISVGALDDYNRAAGAARVLFAVALAGSAAGVALAALASGRDVGLLTTAAVAVIVVGLLGSVVAKAGARRRWVDIELDGSGRWAVLIGVHPEFQAAVSERYLEERPASWPPVP